MTEKHQAHGVEEAERRAEIKLLRRKKMRGWLYRGLTLSSAAGLVLITAFLVRFAWLT
jgi:hypothetical protein